MINELTKLDSNFNEASFKSYIANVFVKLLTSIMLDELDNIKHFLSDNIYNEYQEKINTLNKQNLRQIYDELNVKDSQIINIEITNDNFIITVNLISRYIDYLIDKDTSKLVSGNNQSRIEKIYILTFTKKRNFLQQNAVRKCPGCGASIDVNNNGKCSYCDTSYNLEKYDYILTNITN